MLQSNYMFIVPWQPYQTYKPYFYIDVGGFWSFLAEWALLVLPRMGHLTRKQQVTYRQLLELDCRRHCGMQFAWFRLDGSTVCMIYANGIWLPRWPALWRRKRIVTSQQCFFLLWVFHQNLFICMNGQHVLLCYLYRHCIFYPLMHIIII